MSVAVRKETALALHLLAVPEMRVLNFGTVVESSNGHWVLLMYSSILKITVNDLISAQEAK